MGAYVRGEAFTAATALRVFGDGEWLTTICVPERVPRRSENSRTDIKIMGLERCQTLFGIEFP